jgi:hypothetical protein
VIAEFAVAASLAVGRKLKDLHPSLESMHFLSQAAKEAAATFCTHAPAATVNFSKPLSDEPRTDYSVAEQSDPETA